MPLRNDIESRYLQAMKAKDAAAVSTLRMLRTAIKNAEIEKRVEALTDDQAIEVIGREAKKLKDALADYKAGNRDDLASQAEAEIAIVSTFLPAQMSDDEVREIVKAKAAALGLSGEAAFGRLMGEAMKELKGKADGAVVGAAVKEALKA